MNTNFRLIGTLSGEPHTIFENIFPEQLAEAYHRLMSDEWGIQGDWAVMIENMEGSTDTYEEFLEGHWFEIPGVIARRVI